MALTSSLFCVVTGLEHSGTTVVANAIKSVPGLMGAFECGVALSPIPEPFLGYLTSGGEHWGLNEFQRRDLLAGDLEQAYQMLQTSPLMRPGEKIVDKTPAYCLDLASIMAKLPVPFIVVEKTLDNWMKSNRKRPRFPEAYYFERRKHYERSLQDANVFVIHFENVETEIKEAFTWLGLPYNEELSGTLYRDKLFARTGCRPGRELFEERLK